MKNLQLLRRSIGATAAVGVLTIQQANAALPAGVTDAISGAQTDGVALAGLVLACIIAIAAFKWIRRGM